MGNRLNLTAMPLFIPNSHITDCYGSAGSITFYHKDGKCYWKSRPRMAYPATASQSRNMDIHRRALAAWRDILDSDKELWRKYAKGAEPHRPPFDHSSHISGHNLFVSAYHGLALLGHEAVPAPMPFQPFPMFEAEAVSTESGADSLAIRFRLALSGTDQPQRYRLLTKIQITAPDKGRNPGLMRNCLAVPDAEGLHVATASIPEEHSAAAALQVHLRYLLIDGRTGYRSNFRKLSLWPP